MKKKYKLMILSLVIGIALVIFNYNKFGFAEVINSFRNLDYRILLYYLAVVLTIEILGTFRWSIILRALNHKVSLINLFFYRMAGYSVAYLSPQAHLGGEPVMALLLKREGVNFKRGISSILIDKSVLLVADIIVIFIAGIIIFMHYSLSNDIKILFMGVLIGLILVMTGYFYCMIKKKPFFSWIFSLNFWKKNKKIKNIRKEVKDVENTIHLFYKNHMKPFFYVIVIQVIMYSLMFLEYYLALSLFVPNIDAFAVFLIMGGVAVSYAMPVPMALGVLETTQVSALALVDISNAIGLSISLLVRAKDLTRTLIGGLAMLYYGVIEKIFKKAKTEDEKQAVQFI